MNCQFHDDVTDDYGDPWPACPNLATKNVEPNPVGQFGPVALCDPHVPEWTEEHAFHLGTDWSVTPVTKKYTDICCPHCNEHDTLTVTETVTHAVRGVYPEGGLDTEPQDGDLARHENGQVFLYCTSCKTGPFIFDECAVFEDVPETKPEPTALEQKLSEHFGHEIEIGADTVNYSLECLDCSALILDTGLYDLVGG